MAINKYQNWDTFVRLMREEINRFAPTAASVKEKPQPTWDEFVAELRLRICIDGDDTLTKIIADKDAENARLKERLTKAETSIAKIQEQLTEQQTTEPSDLDTIYIEQIKKAQEFINTNHKADISHMKDFLRKMLPQQFHSVIEQLKDNQDPMVINNFFALAQVLPNATIAEQHIHQ